MQELTIAEEVAIRAEKIYNSPSYKAAVAKQRAQHKYDRDKKLYRNLMETALSTAIGAFNSRTK